MIRVNGETIDPNLIDEAFHRIKSEAEALTNVSCCERDEEFHQQAEEELIDGILLAQEAEHCADEPDKEVVREELEGIIRHWREHGASWDLLEERRDAMRAEVIADLKMRRFTDSVCEALPELEEADYWAWYHDHLDRYRDPAKVHGWHLVKFMNRTGPEEVYRVLVEIRHQVLDGSDFKSTAQEHSEKVGGEIDLGWIEHQRLLNPFEAILFSLRAGEVSPVIFYEQAYHLVWVEDVEQEKVKPYEEVEDEVKRFALADQRRKALAARAQALRETAEIERE